MDAHVGLRKRYKLENMLFTMLVNFSYENSCTFTNQKKGENMILR